jgi:hypothetical protein
MVRLRTTSLSPSIGETPFFSHQVDTTVSL